MLNTSYLDFKGKNCACVHISLYPVLYQQNGLISFFLFIIHPEPTSDRPLYCISPVNEASEAAMEQARSDSRVTSKSSISGFSCLMISD